MHESGQMRRSLLGAASISIQPLLLNVISIPVLALIIRRLGPAGYGYWMTATSLITATAILTNLGLRGTFVRAVARNPECAREALAEQLGARMLLGLFASAVAVGAALLLGYSRVVVECTLISAVGVIFTCISAAISDLLQSLNKLPSVAVANFTSGFALTAISAGAAWSGAGPVGLALAYLAGPILSALILAGLIQRNYFRLSISWKIRKALALLKKSRHFAAQQIVNAASVNIASLLLPKMVGPVNFGFFSAGTIPSTRLDAIPDSLSVAFYPLMSQASAQSRKASVAQMRRSIWWTLLACVPTAILVSAFAGLIARILFPHQAEICRVIILITIWSVPLSGLEYMMSFGLNATDREAAQVRATIGSAICSIIVACALMARWGLWGACWFMALRPLCKVVFLMPEFVRAFVIAEREPDPEPEPVPAQSRPAPIPPPAAAPLAS